MAFENVVAMEVKTLESPTIILWNGGAAVDYSIPPGSRYAR